MAKRSIEQYKKQVAKILVFGMTTTLLMGCSKTKNNNQTNIEDQIIIEDAGDVEINHSADDTFDGTTIELSDNKILVNGEEASTDENAAVYTGDDIVYYEEGKDETYGEGSEKDAHSAEEAAQHTVITITQPGEYKVSGTISYGQIAINLGEDAKEDENAKVTLILDNANINCTVAPAIIVYKAYECGSDDVDTATADVDTTNAGFNLVLADDSINEISGAHVAKIYKEGTTDKLHKYDAAIDSKVSYNINGQQLGNGQLIVNSDNEGISSNLHMTINGGNITINACDDSINTNEDGVSVFTMNGGILTCDSGNGTEGDGIDSNGWIVINGGYIISSANGSSQDSGVDSDNGIIINGGTLLATGNMYDEISSESSQNFAVMNFNEKQGEDTYILLKDSEGNAVTAFSAVNDYSMLIFSSPEVTTGDYTLYQVDSVEGTLNGSIYTNILSYEGEEQLQYTSNTTGGHRGMGGGMKPGFDGENAVERPERPEGLENFKKNEDGTMKEKPEDGEMPEIKGDGTMLERPDMPTDGTMPEIPEDGENPQMSNVTPSDEELKIIFTFSEGNSTFGGISVITE